MAKLANKFYQQDTKTVARKLLGQRLVRVIGGHRLAGLIVETEAYLGFNDPACHSYNNRRTPRIESMYLTGGHSYVYFIYGMYFCFNVVTRSTKHPEAVLIRALLPEQGITRMKKNRNQTQLNNLTSGPGKLCMAMEIDKKLDGLSLGGSEVFIETTTHDFSDEEIVLRPRIGIGYAGEAQKWPLRYFIKGNKFVSKR